MAGSGKTLLFPGTIYNYRAADRTIAPGLRQSGEKPRGEIRIGSNRCCATPLPAMASR